MRKSARTVYNYISLTDSSDEIRRKISRAVTDSGNEIVFSDEKPALSNLLTIYHLFSGEPIKEIEMRYLGKGYKQFKEDLAEAIIATLKPITKKYDQFSADPERLKSILRTGAQKASERAVHTMTQVKAAVGLGL